MKILVTERQYKLIQEQWWLALGEFAAHETNTGTGWDMGFGAAQPNTLNYNSEDRKSVSTALASVQSTKQKAINSKNTLVSSCSKYTNITKPTANAGEIQDFLITLGHNIIKDWSFGDGTARALGTYFYGAKAGVDSVLKLWNKLKGEGYDVGTTSGFGPKMATAISSKISKIIDKIQSSCKTNLTKINNTISSLQKKANELNTKLDDLTPKITVSG
jgi:hypothetical protein